MAAFIFLNTGCGDGNKVPVSKPAINLLAISKRLPEPAYGGVDGIDNVILPKPGSVIEVNADKIRIAGHYVDAVKGDVAQGVIVMVDDKSYLTIYGGDRPDLALALGNQKYLKSQFYIEIPANELTGGSHNLKVRVIANDGSGYYESDLIGVLKKK